MTANQSSTLRVENVPVGTEDSSLEDLFCDYGPIKRCFVVKPKKAGAKKTLGYVQFASHDDAQSAIQATQDKGIVLEGQDLKVKVAPDKRSGPVAKPDPEDDEEDKGESLSSRVKAQKDAQKEFDRAAAKAKKARLIVRNLSFKAKPDSFREHFTSCGEVVDVNILKKPDGKMVGCGFVQFKTIAEASDAIKKLNGKPYLGRPVAVDWAVSKKEFDSKKEENEIKEEVDEVKEEPEEEEIKQEAVEDDVKSESESSGDDDESDENEEEQNDDDDEVGEGVPREKKDWPKTGHDVGENKTVFVRNLGFESEESDLKAMLEENFGRVLFARMVIDKATGHPKGTAFVKFDSPESADACVKASYGNGTDGISLDGRRIYCLEAITKDKADEGAKEKKEKKSKDSRNLYLAREGLVREGTLAAEGVSKADMTKRTQLNRWKKNVLKDLNMFVSPLRLCVRNLPNHLTKDAALRVIIKKHCNDPNAKVTECKIMRDMKGGAKDAPSKGYAFVTFTEHQSALNALRKLNNNPEVFKKDQRPIVEFSIENRKALLARQKRLEKSVEKNPLAQANNKKKGKKGKSGQPSLLPVHEKPNAKENIEDKPSYVGSTNNPKVKGLPSHEGPKVRHNKKDTKISRKDMRKQEQERKDPKLRRKRQKRRAEENEANSSIPSAAGGEDNSSAQPKKKKAKKAGKKADSKKDYREDKQFNDMVNKYKQKIQGGLDGGSSAGKSKWFQ